MAKQETISNTRELRSFLLEQMQGVASGDVSTVTAKGIANLSQQIYNTMNIEVKVAQAKARLGSDTEIAPVSFDG